jgi:SsrA-binding protein
MEIKNKKAYFDYFIIEEIEAGIVLTGTEIKSVRGNHVQLKDSFVRIKDNEAYVLNMNISKYKEANQFNHEEDRTRKLLLHKKEIKKLKDKTQVEGMSIVPLKMYIKDDHAKLLIGLVKGKKLYDKRETIKKRDLERETRY